MPRSPLFRRLASLRPRPRARPRPGAAPASGAAPAADSARAPESARAPGAATPPPSISRRDFLRAGLAAGAASLAGPARAAPRRGAPSALVVGAGFAGLRAALALAEAGWSVRVVEAERQVGGRVRTLRGAFGGSEAVELGGTFIEAEHHELLGLAARLGIATVERRPERGDAEPEEKSFVAHGQRRRPADLAAQLGALEAWAAPALGGCSFEGVTAGHPASLALADRPLEDLLEAAPLDPWARTLVSVAFESEYGLAPGELSALALVDLYGPPGEGSWHTPLGSVGEDLRLVGGNQALAEGMLRLAGCDLALGRRLVRLRATARGWEADLEARQGPTTTRRADAVVLALPLGPLARVDLPAGLSPATRRALGELRYGRNAKWIHGLTDRPWARQGSSGYLLADHDFQVAWDETALDPAAPVVQTLFVGGRGADRLGAADVEAWAAQARADLEACFPGVAGASRGPGLRLHWPSRRSAGGSYSAPGVGGLPALLGVTEDSGLPGLALAGEHCDRVAGSYMEGALRSGRRAAARLLRG